MKPRSKFNHGYLHILLCEKLSNKITDLSLKMFKIMRFLRCSKCSKTIAELKYTTQKANACGPWTACLF